MPQTSLTIAAAARHCGVHRRTLQRAIRAGRLRLTSDARLTLEALALAGYTAAAPQDTPSLTAGDTAPHTAAAPQVTPQVLGRILEVLTSMATSLAVLCERLTPPEHAAPLAPHATTAVAPPVAPRSTPQRRAAVTPQDTPHAPPQSFDTTKYRLGKLCPAGHDYEGTGHSLRVKNKAGYCLACNASGKRRERAKKRQAPVG